MKRLSIQEERLERFKYVEIGEFIDKGKLRQLYSRHGVEKNYSLHCLELLQKEVEEEANKLTMLLYEVSVAMSKKEEDQGTESFWKNRKWNKVKYEAQS